MQLTQGEELQLRTHRVYLVTVLFRHPNGQHEAFVECTDDRFIFSIIGEISGSSGHFLIYVVLSKQTCNEPAPSYPVMNSAQASGSYW